MKPHMYAFIYEVILHTCISMHQRVAGRLHMCHAVFVALGVIYIYTSIYYTHTSK